MTQELSQSAAQAASPDVPLELPLAQELSQEAPRRLQVWRLVALVLLVVGLVVLARWLGLTEYFDKEKLRKTVENAGYWGFLAYFGLFTVGELLHVPGLVFVAAGVFAYGKWIGGLLALFGANLALSVGFLIVRGVGGKALTQIPWKRMEQLMAKLDERPILVVAALRLLFWLAPPVNYALALSSVRFRDFFLGTLIGLTPILIAAILFLDWLL